MSTIKHPAETAENSSGTGRITPLNMRSETNRLDYDSLIQDMATPSEDYCREYECRDWACAAVRG